MPANKNALLRYKIIDRCLNDKYRHYHMQDLLKECNRILRQQDLPTVSRRQIYDDLAFMKSERGWNAPIVSIQDGKSKYITYSEDFSIQETPLTDMELGQLQTLITSLSRLEGLSGEHWIEELLTNLRYRFGVKSGDNKVIEFEQNTELKGLRYLQDLINVTIKQIPINITYKAFGKNSEVWTIHPYYLKQYNNRWYLLGYNEKYSDLSIIPLDRIEGMETTDKKFIRNKDIDFSRYFRNIVGVSMEKEKDVQQVRLKFDEKRFPYIISKPIHHSQIVEDEEQHIISLNVIPNKELISQIIWFGEDVEVLSPDWLREEIKKKISLMYKKYFVVK